MNKITRFYIVCSMYGKWSVRVHRGENVCHRYDLDRHSVIFRHLSYLANYGNHRVFHDLRIYPTIGIDINRS